MRIEHFQLSTDTGEGISISDITPQVRSFVDTSGIRHGLIIISTRHTTTALVVNENESRLLTDIRNFFSQLIPPEGHYLHNDIALRDCPPEEPENAHAHLAAMLLNSNEVIPVIDGTLSLGQWQSILLCELDGPRQRTLDLQLIGE